MANGILKNIQNGIVSGVSKAGLKLAKHSPELCLIGTLVFGGLCVYEVAKNASHNEEAVKETKDEMNEIKVKKATKSDYTDKDARKDTLVAYKNTAVRFGSMYGKAAIFGGLAVACAVGQYKILSGRTIAATAAYATLDKTFKEYRKRVVDAIGEEKERDIRLDSHEETSVTKETDEDGKEVTKETKHHVANDPEHPKRSLGKSVYSAYFAKDTSTQWSTNRNYNLMFIKAQQAYFNNLLQVRGFVFLNDVLDALGIDQIPEGQALGWLKKGNGDGYIDFGVFDSNGDVTLNGNEDYVNGYEDSLFLDFNVDGVMWDKI